MHPPLPDKDSPPANPAEYDIRTQTPELLSILLLDRTRSQPDAPHNIIWANDNYTAIDPTAYAPDAQITPELVTGQHHTLIRPRAYKAAALQKERTKTKAEVFTPSWIVKKQNDAVDANFKKDNLATYIKRRWLEITCGEAPYMANRYEMETGEIIPLKKRAGFIDRKLARLNRKTLDKDIWQTYAELAYQASYGFEWSGDSLLLARENLLYTYYDYYHAKWNHPPPLPLLEKIATIISFNLFQMDGLTYTIPLSIKLEKNPNVQQGFSALGFDSFDDEWVTSKGEPAKVMNWDTLQMELFYESSPVALNRSPFS